MNIKKCSIKTINTSCQKAVRKPSDSNNLRSCTYVVKWNIVFVKQRPGVRVRVRVLGVIGVRVLGVRVLGVIGVRVLGVIDVRLLGVRVRVRG